MLSESTEFNKNIENLSSKNYEDFILGRMDKEEAEGFINKCLDNPEKLKRLEEIITTYNNIKKLGREYKKETKIENEIKKLLKDIYGIDKRN